MSEIARLAVSQHILYLEGECLPRTDITRDLEIWTSLHGLVSTRICVVAHTTPLDREELATALSTIRIIVERSATDGNASDRLQNDIVEALAQCVACAWSRSCPLGDPAAPHIEPSSVPSSVLRLSDEGKHEHADAIGASQHNG
jgi:hypothetical protein